MEPSGREVNELLSVFQLEAILVYLELGILGEPVESYLVESALAIVEILPGQLEVEVKLE
jgi:hypothetical protein